MLWISGSLNNLNMSEHSTHKNVYPCFEEDGWYPRSQKCTPAKSCCFPLNCWAIAIALLHRQKACHGTSPLHRFTIAAKFDSSHPPHSQPDNENENGHNRDDVPSNGLANLVVIQIHARFSSLVSDGRTVNRIGLALLRPSLDWILRKVRNTPHECSLTCYRDFRELYSSLNSMPALLESTY